MESDSRVRTAQSRVQPEASAAENKGMGAFAGYIRISQVGGRSGASFISPDVQEETIRRLAKAHGLALEEPIVQELDVSGGTPIDDRKLGQLVRSVESGASDG